MSVRHEKIAIKNDAMTAKSMPCQVLMATACMWDVLTRLRLLQKLWDRGILRLVDHYDRFPNIPMQLSMHPLMIFMSRELGCFQTNVIHLRSVYFSVPPIASLWLTKCDVSINIKKGVLML